MKKRTITKQERESCEYLFKEIQFAKLEIVKLLQKVERYRDSIYQLEVLAESLTCPEDTSVEAIENNKKLLAQIQHENIISERKFPREKGA